MIYLRIYIIALLLIVFSCEDESNPLINCQDPLNDCYLEEPENLTISSYSPSEILITTTNNSFESLEVKRYLNDEIDFNGIINKNENNQYFDSTNISINSNYNYLIRYNSELGFSNTVEQVFEHNFPGVSENNIQLSAENEGSVNISWYYDINDHFSKDFLSTNWIIIKEKFDEISNSWILSNTIDTTISISQEHIYSINDNYNISLYDSISYSIFLDIDDVQSDTSSNQIKMNFPQMKNIDWLPINASTIYLSWEIDDEINENISSVKITNSNSSGNAVFEEENPSFTGFVIDAISYYDSDILAGQNVDYTIEWCGISFCVDSTFTVSTFPIYHMQYIPAMQNIQFNDENIVSTEAFYIDLFEFDEDIYSKPSRNSKVISNVYPKGDMTIQEARNKCNERSSHYDFLNNIYNGVIENENISGFKLPTESEWFVASAVKFDWNTNEPSQIYNFTQEVNNGQINCNYANILNCFNQAQYVGYYNGENLPSQLSTSPNGLYDCNGNLKEWVEKSATFNHPDNFNIPIMSGDYMSPSSHSPNNFFTYEENSFSHQTIGFRMIIPAQEFLNNLYND